MKRALRGFLLGLLIVVAAGVIAEGAVEKKVLTPFYEAQDFYKERKYKEAILSFSAILEGGYESGAVYYNLGNSYFKDDQLGRAVLNYERAKNIIPRDSDLKANAAYADSLIQNNIPGEEGTFILGLIRSYSGHFTLNELAVISFLAFLGSAFTYLLWLYFGFSKIRFTGTITILISFLSFNTFIFIQKGDALAHRAVIVSKTEAKFEPLSEATVHYKLHEGMKVRVLDEEGIWMKVERADGKVGWVESADLEKIL